MSLLTITAIAAAAFLLAYRFYGTFLAKLVFCLDDAQAHACAAADYAACCPFSLR